MSTTLTRLDRETTARLRAVIGRLSRHLRPTPAAVAAGLTPTRISVLLHVFRAERIRLSELAEAEGLNPTLLSRAVGHLADAGLLDRVSDPADRRAAWVELTAAGKRVSERIRRERTDALSGALHGLTDGERAQIESVLPALEHLAEQLKADRR
jgi:DNA-binding MarR family transcriptional regulator